MTWPAATLQYMRSVGMAQMRWLGVERPPASRTIPMTQKDSYEAREDQHLVRR